MAKCEACGREMLTAKGCDKRVVFLGGRFWPRIRVGDPGDFFEGDPEGTRCGDCGAMVGYFHHPGCDCERCPSCGGQLISCDCPYSIDLEFIK